MPQPWADGPFPLLLIPGQKGAPTSSDAEVEYMAADMANVHNTMLRGLNAIYLQSPHVHAQKDILDFLFFTKTWEEVLSHHHKSEEAMMFNEFDDIAKRAGAKASVMAENAEQHHAFEPGLHKLQEYIQEVQDGKKYDSNEFRAIIDGFAPVLTEHLHDEVKTLMKLEQYGGSNFRARYDYVIKESVGTADSSSFLPFFFSCCDKTASGSENFPMVPGFLPYLNNYVFSWKYSSAWRFSPCDMWSRPRPLKFLGQS